MVTRQLNYHLPLQINNDLQAKKLTVHGNDRRRRVVDKKIVNHMDSSPHLHDVGHHTDPGFVDMGPVDHNYPERNN